MIGDLSLLVKRLLYKHEYLDLTPQDQAMHLVHL